MPAFLEIHGLDDLQKRVSKDLTPAFQRALRKIGELVRDKIAEPPPQPSHPLRWASDKQRAWYFATRRARGLPMRYTRENDPMSQRLLASWTVRVDRRTATVGTRASYAPYVVDAERQTAMHKETGWRTDADVASEVAASGYPAQAVGHEVIRELRG